MSYDTNYWLDARGEHDVDEVMAAVVDVVGYVPFDFRRGRCGDRIPWYSHVEDMIQVSRRFPGVQFRLRGCGEEVDPPDLWAKFFHNGVLVHEEKVVIEWPKWRT